MLLQNTILNYIFLLKLYIFIKNLSQHKYFFAFNFVFVKIRTAISNSMKNQQEIMKKLRFDELINLIIKMQKIVRKKIQVKYLKTLSEKLSNVN